MKNTFICILIIYLITNDVSGQKTSLTFSTTEVRLGITKEKFIDMMPNDFTLRPNDNKTAYFIERNDVALGSIQFDDDNKAYIISKEYIEGKENIYEVISTFYDLINKEFPEKKVSETQLILRKFNDPDRKGKYISIGKDNWDVSINAYITNTKHLFYGVSETITAKKFKRSNKM